MDVLERRSDLIVFDTVGVFNEKELTMVASKHHLLVLGQEIRVHEPLYCIRLTKKHRLF